MLAEKNWVVGSGCKRVNILQIRKMLVNVFMKIIIHPKNAKNVKIFFPLYKYRDAYSVNELVASSFPQQ